jgi:hypothetical protein
MPNTSPTSKNPGLLVEWNPNNPFDDNDDPDYIFDEDGQHDDYDDAHYDWDEGRRYHCDRQFLHWCWPVNPWSQDFFSDSSNEETNIDSVAFPKSKSKSKSETESESESESDVISLADDVPAPVPAPPVPPHYNLRPLRDRTYGHRLDHQLDDPANTQYTAPQILTAYVFTQMSASTGIKVFGQPAIDNMQKEFCQLRDKVDFYPQLVSSLTPKQNRALFVL